MLFDSEVLHLFKESSYYVVLIYQSLAQTLTVTLELIVSELYSGNKYGRCEIDHFLHNCLQGVG